MTRKFTIDELADRWYSKREIQNLAGKYVTSILLKREQFIFQDFWANAEDICLGFNDGYYVGKAAVSGYYEAETEATALRSRLIRQLFPEQLAQVDDEALFGVGQLHAMPLTTPVVEIAGDGKTAKGIWHVFGSDNTITGEGPISRWSVGFLCVDLLRQEDGWKLWHVLFAEDICCPMGQNWTRPQPYPLDPRCVEALGGLVRPPYSVQHQVYRAYSPDRPFTAPPRVPEPYETFAETFSYGA